VTPDHHPPSPSQVDRLAASSSDDRELDDAKLLVMNSFMWMNDAAQQKIDALKRDLEQKDDPPFAEQLLRGALNVALLAGGAAAGELIAGKLLGRFVGGGEARHEFVKGLFEQGIGAGLSAGREKLGGKAADAIGPFIESQKSAIRAAQLDNQTNWITVGRHSLQSVTEARAMVAACSPSNMILAGERQYEATRDAWVGYLAQSKYGSLERPVSSGFVRMSRVVTNMTTRERREATNRSAPGHVPEDAPDIGDAVFGRAPGVLELVADLPEIDEQTRTMNGRPEIRVAYLNGVNSTVRAQYEGRPLSAMSIPRQIVARVDGQLPNFTVNVDEAGQSSHITHAQGAWLRARGAVSRPDVADRDDFSRKLLGVSLLLDDLVPSSIREKL